MYERTTIARTTQIAIVIGIVSASADTPASASTRIVSSVAYAEDEMLSEAKIARPVTLETRSSPSSSVRRRRPNNTPRMRSVTRPDRVCASSASSVATT